MDSGIDDNAANDAHQSPEKHLEDLILRHKSLFEALLNVEGIEDDTVSVSSVSTMAAAEPQQSLRHRSSSTVGSLYKEESILCRSAPMSIDDQSRRSSFSELENLIVEPEEKVTWKQRIVLALMRNYAEIMDALSETNEDRAKIPEPVKTLNMSELRHNIKRCIIQSKPYTDMAAGIFDILIYKNPLATLFTFWVYLCCIYRGYLVTLFMGLLLMQLMINYLTHCRKISLGINLLPRRDTNAIKFDLSGAQLIIEISRKAQILLDYLADFLEKVKNLFVWKRPRTTWYFVCLVTYYLILSIFLSCSWFFTVIGFGIGVKLFVTTYLFHRFPRLRHKLDITVWFFDRLPADKSLHQNTSRNKDVSASSTFYLDQNDLLLKPAHITTSHDNKLKKSARKCMLFDDEKSFPFNVGSGTLHISGGKIVFKYHRFNAGARDTVTIDFDEILSVSKTKALKWTNFGQGTSIEVFIAGRQKPYVFAGMLRRDECYEDLRRFGREYGVNWAT